MEKLNLIRFKVLTIFLSLIIQHEMKSQIKMEYIFMTFLLDNSKLLNLIRSVYTVEGDR